MFDATPRLSNIPFELADARHNVTVCVRAHVTWPFMHDGNASNNQSDVIMARFLLRTCVARSPAAGEDRGKSIMVSESRKDATAGGLRHARMRIETAVLMIRGSESFPTELEDISATGVLLNCPRDWPGQAGQT